MSFARRLDPSAYTDNLYIHKFATPSSSFAARRFSSDTQLFRYDPEPYNEYGHIGFTGAPSAAFQNSFCSQQASLKPYHVTDDGRSPSVADTQYNSCSDAAKDSPVVSNVSQQNSQSVSDSQSSEIEVEFDEDDIRLKLQELMVMISYLTFPRQVALMMNGLTP
jgi:hypothetical protein